MRPRVLLLLTNYPTLSQTYKESEIRALLNDYDVGIVSIGKSAAPYQRHIGFLQAESWGSIERYVDEFQPNWIHGHYLHTSGHLHKVSRYAKTRFTVRTHSFDILGKTQEELKTQVDHVNSEECAGILVFPFLADRLTAIGVHHSKIQIDWPVIDYERFLDTGPQTDSLIINTGACIPKKTWSLFCRSGQICRSGSFCYIQLATLPNALPSTMHLLATLWPSSRQLNPTICLVFTSHVNGSSIQQTRKSQRSAGRWRSQRRRHRGAAY